MPGLPVTFGCMVMLTPGMAGPPDTGTIVTILPPYILAGGIPLATSGSICMMINSLTGVPYPATLIAPGSSGVMVSGKALVRMGDRFTFPPGILLVLGPPAATYITDSWPP